jgi:hypothetical protein
MGGAPPAGAALVVPTRVQSQMISSIRETQTVNNLRHF